MGESPSIHSSSYSLVTDMDHLFDLKTGIYANAQEDGRPWERPTSVELIHGDGNKGFRSMQVCVFAEASAVEKTMPSMPFVYFFETVMGKPN